mmetsp:Transcript_2923/g.7847  ORF Transcript_2923/g.7847 Transcript_2923/m.7847 type:complete len:248 (+) Transcript_2923:1853-2596(+)
MRCCRHRSTHASVTLVSLSVSILLRRRSLCVGAGAAHVPLFALLHGGALVSKLHLQLPPTHLFSIELLGRALRVLRQRIVHEAKALVVVAASRLDQEASLDWADVAEDALQAAFVDIERNAADEHRVLIFLMPLGARRAALGEGRHDEARYALRWRGAGGESREGGGGGDGGGGFSAASCDGGYGDGGAVKSAILLADEITCPPRAAFARRASPRSGVSTRRPLPPGSRWRARIGCRPVPARACRSG